MKIKWYHLASLAVVLAIVGISFPLWTPTPTSVNVSDIPQESISVPPVLEESAVTVPTDSSDGGSEISTGNVSPVFSGIVPFDVARKNFPDAHPVVATFKSLFSDEERQAFFDTPEMKRFLQVLESPEYAEFITTQPTNRETDEFWAKHGFIQDPDRFQKAFRDAFPTGEPEDFELEMRQTFAENFRDADPNNMTNEIINRAPKFLSDPRNRAWIDGYFDGENSDFGAWGENILKNLSANLPEASSPEDVILEDAFLMESPSQDRTVDIPSEADTHWEPDVPTQQDVEKMPVETAAETPNSESLAPNVIDFNQRLTDDSIDAFFAEDSLETLLNQRMNSKELSTEKVQRAMDVLNRYGPKEGLRKLRDSDPEVAKQIEGFIRERKEN